MDLRPFTRFVWVNLAALGVSLLFGIVARLMAAGVHVSTASRIAQQSQPIMYVAFLFGVPFTMGYLAVTARFQIQREERQSQPGVAYWIFFPWLPAFAAMLLAALVAWEGAICLLFAAPILLVMASLGGVIAGIAQRRRFRPAQLSAVALLPFALVVLESHIPDPMSLRSVETTVRIHAPANAVWQNIIRVPAISSAELPPSWVVKVGFPRPVEATLSREGVGGVRQASFTGGLLFTETIDHWETLHDLSFSIHANTENIPPTTLDEHVKVGGRYFDVLEGEYRLEPLPNGDILLHLSSRERVSTHFNSYAGLWTDAVMSSIQNSILQVVKRRAETDTSSRASANRERH